LPLLRKRRRKPKKNPTHHLSRPGGSVNDEGENPGINEANTSFNDKFICYVLIAEFLFEDSHFPGFRA
jgi:hypothetical protein